MRWISRWAVAATMCVGLAVPAGALAHSSLASVRTDVGAAGSALRALTHAGAHHPAVAARALARNKSSMAAAARAARKLAASKNVGSTASALGLLAKQYDRNVRAYTSLIPVTSGTLQTQLASSLQPALNGRTFSDWLLGALTTVLPTGDTTAATGTVSDLLGNLPSLIESLTGVVGDDSVSAPVQAIVAQALTAASGLLDAGISQVQALLPSLPAAAQASIQAVLTQIQSLLDTLTSTLSSATQSISSGGLGDTSLGSALGGQLSQVLAILQSLFAGGTGTTGTGTTVTGTTGTGTTGTGTTGTGTTGGLLGGLPIPSFIQELLGNLGLGGLGSGSGSGAGGLGLGSLPFGL